MSVSFILFLALHPTFWHTGCLKCWELSERSTSQIQGVLCCGQLHHLPVAVHRSEPPSSVMMGDPDPGDSEHDQMWKMQLIQQTFIEHTFHVYSREVKQGPSFQETCCLMGETDLYVTSCKWVLLETKTKCTEKEKFWVREEKGSFPKEVACEAWRLYPPAIG